MHILRQCLCCSVYVYPGLLTFTYDLLLMLSPYNLKPEKTIMDLAGHNNLLLVEAYYLLLGEIYYVVNMLEEISLHNSDSFKVVFIDNITCLIVLPSSLYIYPQMICEGGCCGQQIQRQSVLGGLIDSTLLSFHITIVMNTRVSTQFNTYTGAGFRHIVPESRSM